MSDRSGGARPFPSSVNGRLVGPGEPAVPAADRGFLLGVAVFETIRVEEGVALFFEDHLARMEDGSKALGLPTPALAPGDAMERFLAATGIERAVVRITRTAGPGGGEPGAVVVTARPLPEPPSADVLLDVAEHRKVPEDPLESVKSVSRVRSAVARQAAEARGAFDALVRTTEGDFVEGTVSNLFAVVDGRVLTPPLSRGILAGVVRDLLLRNLPARVEESRIEEGDLRRAAEVIVTNAIGGPVAARALLGIREGFAGEAGEIARAARAVYRGAADDYLRRHRAARSPDRPRT